MDDSKRVRKAKALDEFEGLIDAQVGLPLRKDARAERHVQNNVSVSIAAGVSVLAEEYSLEFSEIWSACLGILRERMEKAVDGLCDEYRFEPLVENGKVAGQTLIYYKFGRRSA